MTQDKSWMDRERDYDEWQSGMKDFLNFTFDGAHPNSTVPCPCTRCLNIVQKNKRDVHRDLLHHGMDPTYTNWIYHGDKSNEGSMYEESDNEDNDVDDGAGLCDMLNTLIRGTYMGESNADHGEGAGDDDVDDSSGDGRNQEPNATAKVFFKLLKEANKELYPGCEEVTKIYFIVKLYQIKCITGMTNRACDLILQLFTHVLPKGHYIPTNLAKVRKMIRDLGPDYKKIRACVNDCVLFRDDNANAKECHVCHESRWKSTPTSDEDSASSRKSKKPLPRKVLWYFPLITRLQRLYMTEAMSSNMKWHKEGCVDDAS